MLLYPSSESKTQLTFLPPASLAIALIALILFVTVFQSKHEAYKTQKVNLQKQLLTAVSAEVDLHKIEYAVIEKVRGNPSILKQNDYAHLSHDVKRAYRALEDLVPPLISLKNSFSWDRYLLAMLPHSVWILILALIFLPMTGFVFEHLYHSVIFAFVFLGSVVALPLLGSFFPEGYWPDSIFIFSFAVASMVLLGWFVAPTATITFELRIWLLRGFQHKIVIPSSFIPLLFFPAFLLDGLRGGMYSAYFHPQAMIAIPVLAVAFALLLIPVATREGARDKDPNTVVNSKLTQVEILLGEEKIETAREILDELINEPLDMDQITRIADLAWQTNQRDICERCYLKALRVVLPTRSFQKMLPIVETMTYRHLSVPASALLSTLDLGIKEKHFQEIKNLLPYLHDHPDVSREDRDQILEKVVDFIIPSHQPDTEFLLKIRQWLGEHEASAHVTEKINGFFQKRVDNEPSAINAAYAHHINRHVDIDLLKVAANYIRLQVKETQPQNVPWTAILAIWGCHLSSDQRGYRGCVFIRFKRKIFGCHFSSADLRFPDGDTQKVSFEDAWSLLRTHTPEDIPFQSFMDFEDYASLDEYHAQAQKFLATSLN